MSTRKLILNNLLFYARNHLGVVLGAAVGSAVLLGALIVGDSVRGSLRHFALLRVGEIEVAMPSGDRLFPTGLADRLEAELDASVAPVLQLLGTSSARGGAARANQVQVLGVDTGFWELGLETDPAAQEMGDDFLAVNRQLAQQLGVETGDTVLVRFRKPSALSRDVPLSPQSDFSASVRLPVKTVVSDEAMGRFSLQANQVAPYTVFVSLERLQKEIEQPGRANLLLAGTRDEGVSKRLDVAAAQTALEDVWELPDAGLQLEHLPEQGVFELTSERIFLDDSVVEAASQATSGMRGYLTYLVDEIRSGQAMTPYSMVTAMGTPVVPPEMGKQEILINGWLAEDLRAQKGDEVTLSYYVIGESDRLELRTNRFTVHAVVPLQGAVADRELMPEFPGVAEAENTHDWDAGFPIDLDKIRPKDEEYWDKYRGTPKAFVTLEAGQAMWANRFGQLTGIRFPEEEHAKAELTGALRDALDPASLGLSFVPLRERALTASAQSYDFGQLFIGFSFFLIVAALLLMGLLFQFGIEQRASEIGTFLALGFTPRQVRNLLLGEGFFLALAGAVLGVAGGAGYARLMLYGLGTIWRDAVGTSTLGFYMEPGTLAVGLVIAIVVSVGTIWLTLRQQIKRSPHELLSSGAEVDRRPYLSLTRRPSRTIGVGTVCLVLGLVVLGIGAFLQGRATAGAFFGAGTLMLVAGVAFVLAFFQALIAGEGRLSVTQLGLRNVARRHRRSLATVALLACGTFLIVSVGSFRMNAGEDTSRRRSGTGGFELLGEATFPVSHNLNTEDGLQFFALSQTELPEVDFVPMRMREGDDASCLNLNRAQQPRLLGAPVKPLQERGAFRFSHRQFKAGDRIATGWEMLELDLGPNTIPAIADQATITWALGKQIGDTLTYVDDNGRKLRVKLVGSLDRSILQGSLLISEKAFQTHFPSVDGYRQFLIDAPRNTEEVRTLLSRALRNVGMEIIPTPQRLRQYNAVQNTYLSTFQVLGGLGLLLGSIGLGVVVLRNVLERRQELAVLLAVGFKRRFLRWLVLSEHCLLLVLGLCVGLGAAIVAILPSLTTPGSELPYTYLGLNLLAVLVNGLLWTGLATWLALRGSLLASLRNE